MKLKGIDGGPHKRRNMWFNSMIREEPYPGLTVSDGPRNRSSLRGAKLGAAWLSSALSLIHICEKYPEQGSEKEPETVRLQPVGAA